MKQGRSRRGGGEGVITPPPPPQMNIYFSFYPPHVKFTPNHLGGGNYLPQTIFVGVNTPTK